MDDNRVLLITTAFPPAREAHAIRTGWLTRYLAEDGWEVCVTAPSVAASDPDLEHLVSEKIMVVRTPGCLFDKGMSLINRLGPGKLKGLINRAYVFGLGCMCIPDPRVDWIYHAISFSTGLMNRIGRPQVIISSSGSYSAHIAAMFLSDRMGIPWIADLGDPWTPNPLPPATGKYHRLLNGWIERFVITKASALVFTCDATAQVYRKWLKQQLPPLFVVPCGFERSEFIFRSKPLDDLVVISYLGTTTRQNRSLLPLLDALRSIRTERPDVYGRIRVQIVGSWSATFQHYAEACGLDVVTFRGWVPYRESIRIMSESDILLLLSNKGGIQIPAKTYMYLASGVPILCLREVEGDATSCLVGAFGGVVTAPNKFAAIASSLVSMVDNLPEWREQAKRRVHDSNLQPYEWKYLAQRMAEVIYLVRGT